MFSNYYIFSLLNLVHYKCCSSLFCSPLAAAAAAAAATAAAVDTTPAAVALENVDDSERERERETVTTRREHLDDARVCLSTNG